jgi:hypothetical protein
MQSSGTDEAVAAFLAAHPDIKGKSNREIDKLFNRDIEDILARLDRGIPELRQRMDALLERVTKT